MKHRQRLPEQVAAHSYKRALGKRNDKAKSDEEPQAIQSILRPAVLRREVKVPETDPTVAWGTFAKRRDHLRRTRSQSSQKQMHQIAPRTFAQTGAWATNGRLKSIPRRSANKAPSEIPSRSGRRKSRKGFIWRLMSLVISIIVLIVAVSFALTGNAFRIAQVQVTGTHNSALIEAIQKQGMQGQNIFLVNVPSLEAQVMVLPLVRTANVSKQWPNQLTITVSERVPVLLWQTSQGSYSVDKDGVFIAKASETPGSGRLPTVIAPTTVIAQENAKSGKGSGGQGIKPGMQINAREIQFARDVFEHLPKVADMHAFQLRYDGTMYANTIDGRGIQKQNNGSFVVVSPAGWKAYLGDANDTNSLNNRLLTLKAIVDMAEEQQLSLASIDLRYGLRPVYTLKTHA
ncbi:cell division protein FtsQ/DivIB [Ktedonospora formicarum]|uniref:POTRA domain-containing protein n=1 Tax=Ktedonospora formicarum TaxID=2778364 RepID=A0A8J3HU18_9CHLR|nr:FtsQ-type POTRA domain-containing protein [Ktedonospora formicarum]GHO43724.1 hypothetical protein KSX_18870 [Ktedonospora formicarum]